MAKSALNTGITGQDGSYLAELLIGDSSQARRLLGWAPKTKFVVFVKLMVDADIELLQRHQKGQLRVSS